MPDNAMLSIDAPVPTAAGGAAEPPPLARVLRGTALGLLAWCVVAVLFQSGTATVETMFFDYDVLWLALVIALLAALSILTPRFMVDGRRFAALSVSRWSEAILAAAVMFVSIVGAHAVFHGHAFTQDETMAWFDATILRHGQLAARIPEIWRPYADALEPRFILPIADHAAWVSCYLPVNAAIRALFDAIPGLNLASAILAGLSIVAIAGVARRLWPERPDAALVAALLLATSSQFLFTASTPFAMSAHLALDLVWLWLFLRGGRLDHAGAIAVGALACGLHQIVFHPLFAAPFIVQLWTSRRWRLAAVYTGAYAVIGLFWVLYWQLMLDHYGLHGAGITEHGLAPFVHQVADLLRAFSWSGVDFMAKNITRFLAWQNPLTLPLAIVGVVALRRLDGPLAAMAAGLALTVAAMFVLLPNQGFGWGYRYVHGLLGSFCLLAAWGWIVVTRAASAKGVSRAWAQLGLASAFTLAIMVPGRAIEVGAVVEPYAAAQRMIASARTDLVFVDANGAAFTTALVRNDPFLRNRPLVMSLYMLTPQQVGTLCATHSVALFDRHDAEALHILASDLDPEFPARTAMRSLGCGTNLSAPPPTDIRTP